MHVVNHRSLHYRSIPRRSEKYRLGIVGLATIVVSVSAFGCRGSQPFRSMVNVTQESNAEMPQIDAPQQRLATANSRKRSGEMSKPSAAADSVAKNLGDQLSPKSQPDQLAAKRSLSGLATQPKSRPVVNRSKSKPSTRRRISAAEAVAKKSRSTSESTLGTSQVVAATPSGTAKSRTSESDVATLTADELMVAFKDYPPEVQQEALRRLVAATARSAERSNQPKSVDDQLAQRLHDLPELPNAADVDPDAPPARRIAADGANSSVVSAARSNKSSAKAAPQNRATAEPSVKSRITDLATAEITAEPKDDESVDGDIARAGMTEHEDASERVRTLAAEQNDHDTPKIAQVSSQRDESNDIGTAIDPTSSPATGQAVSDLSSQQLFEHLVGQLANAPEGETEAERASRLIKLRHLMVLSGDPDRAVERIDGMSEAEQEYLRHQLLGLWTMIDPQGHPVPSRRFSSAITQIREAAKFAAAATDALEVRSLAFCTEIESYGQIKTFPTNRFTAGQQVILYCEIENFTATQTDDGFETHLQGSYDLFNERDEKVVSQLLPADQQTSANYLRDYFIAYQMHLPEQLSKGKYRLQLTMEDVNGKKYGQASIPLEIKK